jgi:hypothetical protein
MKEFLLQVAAQRCGFPIYAELANQVAQRISEIKEHVDSAAESCSQDDLSYGG